MFPNIPMRFLFILFAIFEGLVSYLYFVATPDVIMETHTGMIMSESALHIAKGFAFALAAITVMAFLAAYFVNDRNGLIALSTGFFTYNATVLYYCLYPGFETDFYQRSIFIHGSFALLFAVTIVYLFTKGNAQDT